MNVTTDEEVDEMQVKRSEAKRAMKNYLFKNLDVEDRNTKLTPALKKLL